MLGMRGVVSCECRGDVLKIKKGRAAVVTA